jgi:hypothetical protein
VKVEPLPGLDSTQMRPPCISMIRREIAKPSPVPPFFLVIELSASWNSWNSLAWSAVEIPKPVSRTATLNDPLAEEPLIDTSPISVNLMRPFDYSQAGGDDGALAFLSVCCLAHRVANVRCCLLCRPAKSCSSSTLSLSIQPRRHAAFGPLNA